MKELLREIEWVLWFSIETTPYDDDDYERRMSRSLNSNTNNNFLLFFFIRLNVHNRLRTHDDSLAQAETDFMSSNQDERSEWKNNDSIPLRLGVIVLPRRRYQER